MCRTVLKQVNDIYRVCNLVETGVTTFILPREKRNNFGGLTASYMIAKRIKQKSRPREEEKKKKIRKPMWTHILILANAGNARSRKWASHLTSCFTSVLLFVYTVVCHSQVLAKYARPFVSDLLFWHGTSFYVRRKQN